MPQSIHKADGFDNEEFFVIPPDLIGQLEQMPLVSHLFTTTMGCFPNARYHYCNRPDGCDDFILIYCTAGRGWYNIDHQKGVLTSGQFLMIPAGKAHAYGTDNRSPWTIYWTHFRGNNASVYCSHLPDRQPTAPVDQQIHQLIIQLFDDCFRQLHHGFYLGNLIYASSLVNHILNCLFFANPGFVQGVKTPQHQAIDQSILFMKNHLKQKLSLTTLAKEADLSVPHFSRLFKLKTGNSPVDYFTRLKVHRACQFLSTTHKSVKAIAFELGYDDPYYFSRLFKKVMGLSPVQYQQQQSHISASTR